MSDEKVIKQINESRAEQKLRDSIKEGKEFSIDTTEYAQTLEKYNKMTESEKISFNRKGWING